MNQFLFNLGDLILTLHFFVMNFLRCVDQILLTYSFRSETHVEDYWNNFKLQIRFTVNRYVCLTLHYTGDFITRRLPPPGTSQNPMLLVTNLGILVLLSGAKLRHCIELLPIHSCVQVWLCHVLLWNCIQSLLRGLKLVLKSDFVTRVV